MSHSEIALVVENGEEKSEATLLAENSKKKVGSNRFDTNSEARIQNSSIMKDEHGSSRKWSRIQEIHDPSQESFLQVWKKIFVASCLFAVVLDPLFLYVPMRKDDIKCLQSDRNLKVATLLLRSFTDLFYIFDIIIQIYTSDCSNSHFLFKNEGLEIFEHNNDGYYEPFCFVPICATATSISATLGLVQIPPFLAPPCRKRPIISVSREVGVMASPDVSFVVEKSQKKAARDSDSDSDSKSYSCPDTTIGESSMEEWQTSRKKRPMMIVKILELFHWILAKWKKMFAASCVFAVSLDPLFLYIPIINQDMNCLSLDQNLKITALTLRSVTDLFYVMDIIIEIYTSGICSSLTNGFHHSSKLQFLGNTFLPKVAKMIWQSYILIDILAIIPLPQVLILTFFSKMRASRSLDTRKFIMNFFVLMQYLPRVIRIYLSCKAPKMSHKRQTPVWVKGVLNFFMYILASHVLGAVWYFFAIQQMTVCWAYACRNENGCDSTTFGCHDRTSKNDLCPVSSPNTTFFEFGIFLSLLQSGVPSSTNFLQKFTNCFCWGLRNLSSLGSNLQPSTNTWENLFVVFISIIGLLLFIYLIGNLQTYLSLDTTRIEAHRHKMKIKRKMEEKGQELELWLPKNGIPEKSHKNIKLQMMEKVEQEFEENRDVDLDNFLSTLPSDLENQIKSYMPFTSLKKVLLQNMDEQVLKAICQHLKPMKYTEDKLILREGEPLKMMLFIVEGHVAIEKKGGSTLNQGARELYGEKLLAWPFSTSFPKTLPTATESARAIGDVEALILMADDMKGVVFKFRVHFIKKYGKLKEKLDSHQRPVEATRISAEATPTPVGAAPASVVIALRRFTARELKKATQNYNAGTRIGEGGYGIVYKGILPDKTVVAIKKSKIHDLNSVNEASILSQIRHRNIVKLLGCCLEAKTNVMVYEFIDNGTLYEHIHNEGKGEKLSFELRLKIAAEIAEALSYLHLMSIVHRDVKTANILLNESYTAKVSDFGCSRLLDEDQDSVTTVVKGTFGYLDPDYVMSSTLTEKSDVYSFGVVLLELLTSRRPISRERPREEINLVSFFLCLAEQGHLNEILDGEIINGGNYVTAEKVSSLARRCLTVEREERPSMGEVAAELKRLIMATHQAEKTNFSSCSKDSNNWFLRSPSNSYVVDVKDEGDDVGSSASISY
ncbi:uncharacterized protein LOC110747287 [Prunus avium]|uniref:Uncharacterized protein LOC110747287 n=1 Tax=Prunus avium TaxID=42229 RepID=A0A6P5RQ44_PRUAV|nr:uncharacterized protein LOC110747287 [Prunus avium]